MTKGKKQTFNNSWMSESMNRKEDRTEKYRVKQYNMYANALKQIEIPLFHPTHSYIIIAAFAPDVRKSFHMLCYETIHTHTHKQKIVLAYIGIAINFLNVICITHIMYAW